MPGLRSLRKNIRIFKSWGVIEVFVKGEMSETKTADESSLAGVEATLKQELEAKFSDVLKDPVMAEILNAATKQLMKNLSKSEHETENSRSKKNYR